jgi:hypothetical protein
MLVTPAEKIARQRRANGEQLGANLLGGAEVALAGAGGLASLLPQGINTLLGLPFAGVDNTIKTNERIADFFTRTPTTEAGIDIGRGLSETMQPVAEADASVRNWLGNKATIEGLPTEANSLLYAGGTIVPEIVGSLLGVGAMNRAFNSASIAPSLKPGFKNEAGAVGGGKNLTGGLLGNDPRLKGAMNEDGLLSMKHFSNRELDTIDPANYGEALSGRSKGEKNRSYHPDFQKRSYYGLETDVNPYKREAGLGSIKHEASISPERIYDADTDVDKLFKGGDQSTMEKSVFEAGYAGYMTTHPSLGNVAVVFDKLEAKRLEESGFTDPIIEKKEPDTKKRPARRPKPPRRTAQETIDLGLKHPIGGGKVLSKPIHEMDFETKQTGPLEGYKELSPQDLVGGQIQGLLGDTSQANHELTSFDGYELETPVKLGGGPGYMMMDNGNLWAADASKTQTISKYAKDAVERGEKAYGAFVPMALKTGDFNTMNTDTAYEAIKAAPLTKKAIREFDAEVASKRSEWKGMNHPDSRAMLDDNGALRQAFMTAMGKPQFQSQWFPEPAHVRLSTTNPDFINAKVGQGGQYIGSMTGERGPSGHKTYNSGLLGEMEGGFLGQAPEGIPLDVMFTDKANMKKMWNDKPGGLYRAMDLGKYPQYTDQRWADHVQGYMDDARAGNDLTKYSESPPTGKSYNLTDEDIPSTSGGHHAMAANMSRNDRRDFSKEGNMVSAGGHDIGLRALRKETYPTLVNKEGRFNLPGQPIQNNPLQIGRMKTDGLLDDAELKEIEALQGVKGLLTGQDGAASNMIDPLPSGEKGTGVIINSKLTTEQKDALYTYGVDNDVAFVDNGDGTNNLFSLDYMSRTSGEFNDMLESPELKGILDDADLTQGTPQSTYTDLSDEFAIRDKEGELINKGLPENKGAATDKIMGLLDEAPMVGEKLFGDREFKRAAERLIKRDGEWFRKHPEIGAGNPAMKTLRKIVSDPKSTGAEVMAALKKAVIDAKAGGTPLPAAFGSFLMDEEEF